MAKSDPCPKCGVNMNMVGKAHRCVPRASASKSVAVTRAVVRKTTQAVERAAVKSSERPPAVPEGVVRGRGRPKGPERKAVLVELEPGLLERVDAYTGANGLPSRTAGIRALLEKGLK